MNVKNSFDKEISFDVAVSLMDDEIREKLANDANEYTEQEFFDAYAAAHEQKFGETWELDKPNPVY